MHLVTIALASMTMAVIDDLSLDNSLVVVPAPATAVVVAMVMTVKVVAPRALPLDLARAVLA